VSAKVLVIVNSTGRSYKTDRARAKTKVAQGKFSWQDNFTIVEVERRFQVPLWDGPFGTGNLLPFSHIQNRLRAPAKLHYSIPAVGASTRVMHCAWNNFMPSSMTVNVASLSPMTCAKGGGGDSPEQAACVASRGARVDATQVPDSIYASQLIVITRNAASD